MLKTIKRIFTFTLLSLGLLIVAPKGALAASASLSYSGETTIIQGRQYTYNIRLNADSLSKGYQFDISFDGSYLQFMGFSNKSSLTCTATTRVVCYSMSGPIQGSGTIGSVTFKALRTGSTSISFTAAKGETQTGQCNFGASGLGIRINEPPSENANLSSLSVSGCNIGFNGGTSYSCTVDANVGSVSVSASAQDGGARVSGTGNKSLSYGGNRINVTVTAPAGNSKTYSINVTRKDNRSSNNNLESLSVSDGSLSPGFNSNTTEYSISVPFSVTSLNLKYKASDGKSKVSVSNNNLEAEATTNVTITVTAENGSTKTYTIKASRGKDPNKVLNTDNYLKSLTIDTGLLSPAFDKETTNYVVYLPYEVQKINFNYEVSDTKYGVVNFNGPESLGIGNNVYTISVKAENESERVYTITVVRAKILNGESSTNALLASLTMHNGEMTQKFDSGVHLYYYNKSAKKDITLEGVAQDPESIVTYLSAGAGVYAVLVTAPSGNMSIYIAIPKEMGPWLWIIIVLIAIVLIGVIIFIIKKIRNKKDSSKSSKKDKKKKKKSKNDIEEE